MAVTSFVKSVSPQEAQKYLDSMVKNRNLNERIVAVYADTMTRGEWRVNGEAVILDEDDKMIDGQHRCSAVVRCGKNVDMLVVRGVKRGSFDTIDIGRKRSCGDVLGINGISNPNLVSAALTVACRWEAGNIINKQGGAQGGITPHQSISLLRRWPDMVDAAEATVTSPSKGLFNRGYFVFLRWATLRAKKDLATKFWTGCDSGENLVAGTGSFALRARLILEAGKVSQTNKNLLLPMGIKAWNAYAKGEKIVRLLQREIDAFPSIYGFSPMGTEIK